MMEASLSPRGDRAVYKQVADLLRRAILNGELQPGDEIPSEDELCSQYDLSRTTARRAVAILRGEGLIVTERGRRSRVRPERPVRRVASTRYSDEFAVLSGDQPRSTSYTRDHGIDWSEYSLTVDVAEVVATGRVAEAFGIAAGTPVWERRFVQRARGVPTQIMTSYLRSEMVRGTPVADPANEPWPGGTIGQLHSLGVVVTAVVEEVRTRMPLPEEADALDLFEGTPVFDQFRLMYAGDTVVEVGEVVMPGESHVLVYRIDVAGPTPKRKR